MGKVAVITAVAIVLLLLGAFAFASGGAPGREPAGWLAGRAIAHRGAWTDGTARPENSLAAFDAAAAGGYAVELDAQGSLDGVTVVIHDEDLERMTGAPGLVAETPLVDLQKMRLLGGAETIPRWPKRWRSSTDACRSSSRSRTRVRSARSKTMSPCSSRPTRVK